MKIEIWSDVMCPFCYMGKRNLETALLQFEHADKVDVVWKSYQLDSAIPEEVNDTYSGYLSGKRNVTVEAGNEMLASVTANAKQLGLDYHFEKTVMTNSFKAHCLIQFAKSKGKGAEMEELLFKAFFTDGKNVSDTVMLKKLGKEAGLDESQLDKAFTDDIYASKVKNDIEEARQIGVTGVPFFVFDRKYAISGAQPPEVMLDALNTVFNEWTQRQPGLNITEGQSCDIDGKCD